MSRSYTLDSAQYAIYIECINDPKNTAYNLPFIMTIDKDVDLDRLISGLEETISLYPVLRSHIGKPDEHGNVIMVEDDVPVRVERFDISDEEFDAKQDSLVRTFRFDGERLSRFELYVTPTRRLLYVDIHHIIFDGVAYALFIRNLRRAYDGDKLSGEQTLFADFIDGVNAAAGGDEYMASRSYFDDLLAGVDGESVPERDIWGETPEQGIVYYDFELDEDKITAFRKETGCTKSNFFTASVAYAVSLFAGSKDALINNIWNCRDRSTIRTAGMFVRTIPFFAGNCGEGSVAGYFAKAHEQIEQSKKHTDYPYMELAGRYGLNNAVSFGYQGNLAGMFSPMEGITFERLFPKNWIESILFLVEIGDIDKGKYRMSIRYRADHYSSEYVDNVASTIINIFDQFLNCKEMSEIDAVPQSHIDKIKAFNANRKIHEKVDVVTLFRRAVNDYPDRTAVVYEDRSYTYKELDEITERLASFISSKGLGKGDVVSVLIPRNEYITIASLGVLKAGCAYQPLDSGYPEDRLDYMIKDAGVRLLITCRDLRGKLTGFSGDVLYIEDIPSLPEADYEAPVPSVDDLFILLYTSGTTGKPKGVMLTHGNIAQYSSWYCEYSDMNEGSRIAAYASYGFDANTMDQYPTLISGAAIYIISEELRMDLLGLVDYFNENGITHAFMTTQVGRQFEEMYRGDSLKVLCVGGEKLVPVRPPQGHRFINGYGPTETTDGVTYQEVDRLYNRVPVGSAVAYAKLYVVDERSRLLPVGALGELCIAGYGVAKGYLNLPDKTAEAFTPNPFCDEEGYRTIYHTGDIVRFLTDGRVDFIGRNDGQVKVRGFRIELAEVEAEIRQFPGIKDATVQSFDNPGGGKFIAAYIVSDSKIDVEELNKFIKQHKPAYMVPAVTMQIDSIPLNRNQKVDKRALPEPVLQAEDLVPPQNDMQRQIADIVSDILGHEAFGINTDLWEAGLTSISTMKLMVRLSEQFDVPVRIQDIRANGTVEKLESFILSGSAEAKTHELQSDYPLTKTQEGVLVECMTHPDSVVYNIPFLFKLNSSVDLDKLENAVRAAFNAHPYIKLTIRNDDDGDFRCERHDEDDVVIERVNTKINMNNLVKPFKLFGNPLYRISLIDVDAKYLFMDVHHIVADGESMAVIIDDINAAYSGEVLTAERYTGFDIALDEQDLRQSDEYTKAKEYYSRLLEGLEPDHLPLPDRKEDISVCSRVNVISEIDHETVLSFCSKNNISENILFNGAFGYLLSCYNDREDALYTTLYDGRNDSRLINTVDMLVKTLPVYVKTSNDMKIRDYLTSLKEQIMNSMNNVVFSFAEISHEFGVVADIMFAWQKDIYESISKLGGGAELIPFKIDDAKFKLYLDGFVNEGKYYLGCEYQTGLYTEDFIKNMISNLEQTVKEFITKETFDDIELLSPEKEAEIEQYNNTSVPVENTDIVTLFRRAAKEYSDHIAVVCGDDAFTYSQVDDMTDRIASFIMGKGLGAGDAVSVLIPRCAHMVTASLGVLKAGCAYQPLDPAYPEERLQYMVKDAGIRLIIAERSLISKISGYEGDVLYLDEITGLPEADKTLPVPDPSDLFILLYTSGTTGVPKGVMLEHYNLVNFCKWYHRYTEMTPDSRASAYASYGFDCNMLDLYPALTIGATVYIIPEDMRLNLMEVQEYFEENAITHSFMTTQIGRQFKEMYQGTTLKCLSAAGEKLAPTSPAEGYRFINGYGPTECTIFATAKDVDRDYHRIPIGIPLDNYKAYIVSKNGKRLPVGIMGELCIAGLGVGRGYLNLPEKTAQVFTANPFSDEKGYERMYHTGDIVRLLPNGDIDFIGRNDGQVKIRGFRIELSEIEQVIRQCPGIKDVTVQAFDDANGGKYIAAYLVSDQKVDIDTVAEFVRKRKPAYMVPGAIMQIDKIPLNQNQKVNRRALPVIELRNEAVYVEPENDIERDICDLYAEILGLKRVGATDNFFEIGGTSIIAAKIITHAMSKGYQIVYKDIFDNPTPRELALVIAGGNDTDSDGVSEKQNQVDDYDYSAIDNFISVNTMENVDDISFGELGNIILTGATGFLGMHVLRAFLESNDGIVYCLIRKGRYPTPERRLMSMLSYYFDDPMKQYFDNRIVCIEGDITSVEEISRLKGVDAGVLINCAACVKHFVEDDLLDRVNYHGVKNLIDHCVENNIRLVQTSTYSVGGQMEVDESGNPRKIYENRLYFGQSVENDYVRTKFLAERAVLEARITRGLDACIVRLGNLMSRRSDGEFQINFLSNSFMRSLRAYKSLGQFPITAMDSIVEFSPIDTSAAAVLKYAAANSKFSIFHGYNNHVVTLADVITAMKNYGFDIDIVPEDEFRMTLAQYAASGAKSDAILSLVAYNNKSGSKSVQMLGADNRFSINALYRGGFKWPIIDDDYLANAIEALDTLMFFDDDD